MVANNKKFNVEVKGNPLNSPLFTPPPRQVQQLFSLAQTIQSKRSSYALINVSIIPPWLCAKILLSSAVLVVESQQPSLETRSSKRWLLLHHKRYNNRFTIFTTPFYGLVELVYKYNTHVTVGNSTRLFSFWKVSNSSTYQLDNQKEGALFMLIQSLYKPIFCHSILLESPVLVVKSQHKLSGFKTHETNSGAYQSVKLDNHNTIISNLWLFISSWFCMVGWMRKYNTLFRGIAHAVSVRAVLNHPTFKENLTGAKKMAVKYYCSLQSLVTLSTRIICNHMGVRYGFA